MKPKMFTVDGTSMDPDKMLKKAGEWIEQTKHDNVIVDVIHAFSSGGYLRTVLIWYKEVQTE